MKHIRGQNYKSDKHGSTSVIDSIAMNFEQLERFLQVSLPVVAKLTEKFQEAFHEVEQKLTTPHVEEENQSWRNQIQNK